MIYNCATIHVGWLHSQRMRRLKKRTWQTILVWAEIIDVRMYCCQAFYQWKNTHYPIKIHCVTQWLAMKIQLTYRTFYFTMWKCVVCVIVYHLTIYSIEIFIQASRLEIDSSTSQFNVLQFPCNVCWDSFDYLTSLPLFRSHCFNELNMESQCEHFGCAWYNIVSVFHSIKITPTYPSGKISENHWIISIY